MTQSLSLRSLDQQVWVQAIGRLLCQISFGLLNFYIPILFVNDIGLSATAVGFSLSLSAVMEVAGHFLGGLLADSRWGRKTVLSLSALCGLVVSALLIGGHSLDVLILASLILGLSLGFYWTASSAAVMDASVSEQRHHAFAVMGVAEYGGIGIGVLGGSWLLAGLQTTPQLLFVGCGAMFLLFLILIQLAMPSTQPSPVTESLSFTRLGRVFHDRRLMLFMAANVFFTTYVALVTSTLPLYFTNFVTGSDRIPGVSVSSTANLFTWCYVGVGAILQLPINRLFSGWQRVRVLMVAMGLWAIGFFLLWAAGTFVTAQFLWGIAGLGMLSIASVAYKPFSVAIVAELAPASLRGIYVAVSSQCWTIGYFVGPLLGGWAMDQTAGLAHRFWLGVAASTVGSILLLGRFATLQSSGPAPAEERSDRHPSPVLTSTDSQPIES